VKSTRGGKLEAILGSLGDTLERLASTVKDGFEACAASARDQLDAVLSRVEERGEDLNDRMDILELEFDNADERRHQDTRNIIRAVHRTGAQVVGCIAVLAVVVVLVVVLWIAPPAELSLFGKQAASEDVRSSAQDGGRAAANLVLRASQMPKGGVPGQRRPPCPAFEVMNDLCWKTVKMTAEQVNEGGCDDPNVYEPSDGWCASHRTAYLPVYSVRRRNAEKQ